MIPLLLEREERMRIGSAVAIHITSWISIPLTENGLNKVGNLLGEVHVVAVARQKRACAEINTNISPFQPPPYICRIRIYQQVIS